MEHFKCENNMTGVIKATTGEHALTQANSICAQLLILISDAVKHVVYATWQNVSSGSGGLKGKATGNGQNNCAEMLRAHCNESPVE